MLPGTIDGRLSDGVGANEINLMNYCRKNVIKRNSIPRMENGKITGWRAMKWKANQIINRKKTFIAVYTPQHTYIQYKPGMQSEY